MTGLKLKIANFLKEQFGIDPEDFLNLDLEFEEKGKRRIYVSSAKPCPDVQFHHRGIYFGTLDENGFRPSIEGSFLIGKLAKRNVLVVDDEKAKRWMSGEDLECKMRGYVIVKWRDFFLGCGKSNGRVLRNFIPKNRRIR
jgi:NOL1/NOP2/fmu family ribosome biogenesis protein